MKGPPGCRWLRAAGGASVGLALALSAPSAAAIQEADLLPPEQAFALHADAGDGMLHLIWTVADGYYLYRDRIRVRSDSPEVVLGAPVVPAGTLETDPNFGQVRILRHTVRVDVPWRARGGRPAYVDITATSRGCADVGVCYPPHTQRRRVALARSTPPAPGTASPAPQGGAMSALPRAGTDAPSPLALLGAGSAGGESFLEPDQAFVARAEVRDGYTLVARWRIADGYYLYRKRLQFALEDAPGVRLGPVVLPPGTPHEDGYFGRSRVFFRSAEAIVPLKRAPGAARTITLRLRYQGCARAGLCYPPITRRVTLELPPAPDSPPDQGDAGGGAGS